MLPALKVRKSFSMPSLKMTPSIGICDSTSSSVPGSTNPLTIEAPDSRLTKGSRTTYASRGSSHDIFSGRKQHAIDPLRVRVHKRMPNTRMTCPAFKQRLSLIPPSGPLFDVGGVWTSCAGWGYSAFVMAKVTIGVSVFLILLGVVSYFATGMVSVTALIPAFFGVVLLLIGWLALRPNLRMHAMHGAVLLALLGLGGSFGGVVKAMKWIGGTAPDRPAAVVVQTIMAVVLVVYVILCVRSFIDARRNRTAASGV